LSDHPEAPAGPAAAPASRRALAFVVLVVLLDTLGFGIIIPALPAFIGGLASVPINEAAAIGGWLISTYAIAQFLFAPVLGGLSDRFGRRPVLLMSTAGFAASYLIAGFAESLWVLFIGRALAGMTGASFSVSYAYIADITPPERRAERFGLIGVAFGIGFIIGPALGGFLGAIDPRAPFFAAAGFGALNLLLGLLFLPESLKPHLRRPFDWARSNAVGSVRQISRLGGALAPLAAAIFLWTFGLQSLHGSWSYISGYRYSWSPLDIGLSLAAVGVLAVLVNGLLVRRAVDWLGEWRTAVVGVSAGAIGYSLHALAVEPWIAYAAIIVGALGGLTVPAIQALMTSRAPADAQGELQGAITTLTSLTVMTGPPVFSHMLTAFSGEDAIAYAPGAPFLLSIACALAALVMLHRVDHGVARERPA
jgi:DHA1 family tetracycline resistance protein-like MFS transporter